MFDLDTIYNSIYERTLAHLENQSQMPSFDIINIEKELEALYIYEGQDWGGRGEVKEIEISATIAAYQVFLNEFRK